MRRVPLLLMLLQIPLSLAWWYLGDLKPGQVSSVPESAALLVPLSGPAAIFILGQQALPSWVFLQAIQFALLLSAYASSRPQVQRVLLAGSIGWWVLCGLVAAMDGI